jgi:hypothetical protein
MFVKHPTLNLYVSKTGEVKRTRNGKPLKGFDNGSGYLYINVPKGNGERSTVTNKPKWMKKYVHRLVLETYKFDYKLEKSDAHHMNGIRSDNRLENLIWLSRGDNLEEAFMRRYYTRNDTYFEEEELHL